MASIINGIKRKAPSEDEREWITPDEQRARLFADSDRLIHSVAMQVVSSVSGVADMITDYAIGPQLTNWYTALERIKSLPEKVPALPWNIVQILNGKCPIYEGASKVWDTGSLYLKPAGSRNQFLERVRIYGEQKLNEDRLEIVSFAHPECRTAYDAFAPEEPSWVWLSHDILPGTRNKDKSTQIKAIEELNKKAFVDYKEPELDDVVVGCFLHKIATGASLYPRGNEKNGFEDTYTRVKPTTWDWKFHFNIGCFAPSGIRVEADPHYATYADMDPTRPDPSVGMAVTRAFSK